MDLSSLLLHWSETRQGLYQALDMLDDAQLDFVPHTGLWSLREVACHIPMTEEGWFRYQVTRELDDWPDISDPRRQYPSVASIKTLLAETHARTEAYFATGGAEKMKQEVTLTWGSKVDVGWVFWHVLEHEIHHRGEIYLMLGMQGIEAPDV